jgi:hypothetical protein
MTGARGHQLRQQTAQRQPHNNRWRVQRVDQRDEVVGVVAHAQRRDFHGAFLQGQFVMTERRGVHRVTALFEGRPSRTPTVATGPRAVDENDVLGVGHETKDDSQCARHCP